MLPRSSLPPRSRNYLWFLTALLILVISWVVIQTTLAATIYIVGLQGGGHPGVAVIGGKPVISYYDTVNKDLMLAVCDDAPCTTFTNTTRLLDTTLTSSAQSVVVDSGGNPVIGYLDSANGDLKVAVCSDPTCSTPPTVTTLDNTVIATAQFSMTVIGGNPAFSYQDAPNQDLNVAICVDPTCAAPPIIRTLDASTNNVGLTSSITSLGGNPVVSYVDITAKLVRLASCSDPTCSAAPTLTTVTALVGAGTIGGTSSMIIVGGNPLIAFESAGGSLSVAACSTPTCSTGTITTLVDNTDPDGLSLTMVNGMPAIAYSVSISGANQLRLANCNNLTCSSSTIATLNGILEAPHYPSMVSLNNYPAISYYDSKNGQIRFYFGGDEGNGLTTTPTPSPTVTPTATPTATPTLYATPGQVGTLVPLAPAASDAYGSAVAVSGDTVVVGAPYHDHDGLADAGKVYVYKWNGTIWALQAELIPADAASGQTFGNAVGIYGDTIIAGAQWDFEEGDSAGAAYIFTRTGTIWSQQAKLTAPDARINAQFGKAVSISVDTVLIGAPGDDQAGVMAGAAYVFARGGTVWSLQQKLMAGDPVANSQFGYAVDLYADTAVIGAPRPDTQTGAAYVFIRQWNTPNWSQQQKLIPDSDISAGDHFGASVAVYNDAIVVGAPEAEKFASPNANEGAINVFNRSNGMWTLDNGYSSAIFTAAPSSEPQRGGASVDVYRETFLAGLPGAWWPPNFYPGAVFLITRSPIVYSRLLRATPPANLAQVGAAVARDGSTVVVGAPADDFFAEDSGAVYIFRVVAPPFQPTASVTPSYTPSPTPSATNTPYTPTSPPNATPGPHFFAVHHPVLTWNRISWAQAYQIQLDDDPNFGSPIAVPAEFSADILSYMVQTELADGIYYWHVRARGSATDWGSWSAKETIIVSAP